MNSSPPWFVLRLGVLVSLFLLAACGGGGGGSELGNGEPVLLRITADGLDEPLWPPSGAEGCSDNVAHNARLVFHFGGSLDPANAAATAASSVRITSDDQGSAAPQSGVFEVQDDPTLPAGNRRILVFQPDLTPTGAPVAQAGYRPGSLYAIDVLAAGQAGAGLIVGPGLLRTPAQTCFVSCSAAAGSSECSVDPIPGAPFIEATTPASSDPSPDPAVDPASLQRISLFCNEPLRAETITNSSFVVTRNGGLAVAYTVQVYAAGSPEAGASGTRIDLILPSGAAPSTEYVVTLGTPILDFGQSPLVLYDPAVTSATRRVFQTGAGTFCEQAPIVEDFGSTANLGSATGIARWTGDGFGRAVYDDSVFGNGAFGTMLILANTTLDTGMPPMTGGGGLVAFADGAWNLVDLSVVSGATLRVFGTSRPAHFRCLGTASVLGTINASAGTLLTAAIGTSEQGPRPGNFNNGGGVTPAVVAGGVGGPGAGKGGDASQADSMGPQARTPRAEPGHGPAVGGSLNSQDSSYFGGGAGGVGGFRFPQGGVQGEAGGVGGAGGSARLAGEIGAARTTLAAGCVISASTVQAISETTGPTQAFMPPISLQSGGSGGGGGGDKFEFVPFSGSQLTDDQGGGGGGGGGAVRISAAGTISILGSILCNGAGGAAGNTFFAGGGGGGSGGEIWIQSGVAIGLGVTTSLSVLPGSGPQACSALAGGSGGAGTIQLEDSDGVVPNAAMFTSSFVTPFPFAEGLTGTLTSQFRDTGYVAPQFIEASAIQSLGNINNSSLEIRFQGARESASGQPDLATVSAPVLATEIAQLNGYRFIRFIIEFRYAGPPFATPTSIFPSVDEIRIRYSTTRCSALPG
jgi:hypothetical protein